MKQDDIYHIAHYRAEVATDYLLTHHWEAHCKDQVAVSNLATSWQPASDCSLVQLAPSHFGTGVISAQTKYGVISAGKQVIPAHYVIGLLTRSLSLSLAVQVCS